MSKRKRLEPEVPPLSPLPPAPVRLPVVWRVALALALSAYLGLGFGHLRMTPVLPPNAGSFINAPDEAAHLGFVQIVAQERRLPVKGDPTYEWHQPPLYYALVSPFYEMGPLSLRAVTLLMGLASLVVVLQAVRRAFPEDPPLAVLAVGIAALIPMRQAVTASVGNDALIEFWFSLALYQMFLALAHGLNLKRALLLGFTLGLALLTKATGLLLIPVLLYALYLIKRQGESKAFVLKGGAYALAIAFVLASPWYLRNLKLYGEITPVKAFIHEFQGTAKASDLIGQPWYGDYWTGLPVSGSPMTRIDYAVLTANWSARSFWGAYTTPGRGAENGRPSFMPPQFYLIDLLLVLTALAGLVKLHFRRATDLSGLQRGVVYLCFLTLFLVAASFFGFVWTFFQAQGRYLYPALLPICLLAALGFRAVVPAARRDAVFLSVLGLMAVLAVAFLFSAVVPAYSATQP